ncbi:signal peptidase I [Rhodospirillum rubrum]|uniref:Signal peptidase I n=1 Tax=Rhodospirillum rubrum (strain ATCC 11170 / ATH 1.1.1 / DSM 467 / LMG 4362 / NCIMB 8255 / S1) TaxID=269796 RepID=Q2RT92_RHORT|nr:signal peptidase I [Rhodospirillum rubrum]ABC22653.1 signal peptidase I. Serine peptidase. MEROPS family S26A [Rhodospirillum rubrum ATCC 11170]AEO48371.1 signal peptidase I [Rhodospirillum rubrum F11]MBK5954250.1 S26 family signal peptidase [Rhodospirillum rubrum]QXG82275.1 signal peptidase I [Rhodospirillum rubrum]HAQ01417.1 signal peptidase I [Rhodospirillum rubrum]
MSRKKGGGLGETIKTVVYAFLIAIVIRTFAYEPFRIPSGSMIPTLLVGDYLFVSKFSYGYSRFSFPMGIIPFSGRVLGDVPKRGDVVVFKEPNDTSVDFIKRVVGLPGDRIQVIDGILNVNGEPVRRERTEDFVQREAGGSVLRLTQYQETLPNGVVHPILEIHGDTYFLDNTREFRVPEGHYFMMGDNRDSSQDSRATVGFVPAENLVGRAEFVFFSHDGSAAIWQVWKWPFAIRWDRFFHSID